MNFLIFFFLNIHFFKNPEASLQAKLAYYAVFLVFQIIKHLSPDMNRIINSQYIEKAVDLFTRIKSVVNLNFPLFQIYFKL